MDRKYLFLAVETALAPNEVLLQEKPSIVRLCGLIADTELKELNKLDLKIKLETQKWDGYTLDQWTTYNADTWDKEAVIYQDGINDFINWFSINNQNTDNFLGSHNYKYWLQPVLYNFIGQTQSKNHPNLLSVLGIISKSKYSQYICTQEILNVYNMLYDHNISLSLDKAYNQLIGKEINEVGAMEKCYKSLEVFRFFKENSR